MSYRKSKIDIILFIALLALGSSNCKAQETQTGDSQQHNSKSSRDGYYLSIGLGYRYFESPLRSEIDGWQVVFNGRYQWNGLFVELATDPSGTKNLPSVGYNFYSNEYWNLDLIGVAAGGRTEFNYNLDGQRKQISSEPTRGFGFRAMGAWGNTTLQLAALDSFNRDFRSDSLVDYASLWLGHRWQIRNWSLNGLVGAKYRSAALMNYHFGVSQSDADELVSAYQTSSGVDYTAQIDAAYPISKNVLFQIYSRNTFYSDEASNSPMVKFARQWDARPEQEREFGVLLNYVF